MRLVGRQHQPLANAVATEEEEGSTEAEVGPSTGEEGGSTRVEEEGFAGELGISMAEAVASTAG